MFLIGGSAATRRRQSLFEFRTEDVVPLTNQAWRQHAACKGVEPEVFYPVTDEEAEIAKAICNVCSVRGTCLEYALTNREREGVWGGATEKERRRIVRQRRRSA